MAKYNIPKITDKGNQKILIWLLVGVVAWFAGRKIFRVISEFFNKPDPGEVVIDQYCKDLIASVDRSQCSETDQQLKARAVSLLNGFELWGRTDEGKVVGSLVRPQYRAAIEKAVNDSHFGYDAQAWAWLDTLTFGLTDTAYTMTLKEKFIKYRDYLSLKKSDYQLIFAYFGTPGGKSLIEYVDAEDDGQLAELIKHIFSKSGVTI